MTMHSLAVLNEQFGTASRRLFWPPARAAPFPVRATSVSRVVGERFAVIGNAANHLHPVAGQGLNLGLRDAAVLGRNGLRRVAARDGDDPGDALVLARYAEWRRGDQVRVCAATDALVRLFSNRFAPLVAARGLGFLAFDLAGAGQAPLRALRHGARKGAKAGSRAGSLPVNYDVAVVGGGMIGATLACALAKAGLRVAVIEASEGPATSGDGGQLRVSAITRSSEAVLRAIDVWDDAAAWSGPACSVRCMCGTLPAAAACTSTAPTSAAMRSATLSKMLVIQRGLDARMRRPRDIEALPPGGVGGFAGGERPGDSASRRSSPAGTPGGRRGWQPARGCASSPAFTARAVTMGKQALVATVRTELWHRETAWQRFPARRAAGLSAPAGGALFHRLVDAPGARASAARRQR